MRAEEVDSRLAGLLRDKPSTTFSNPLHTPTSTGITEFEQTFRQSVSPLRSTFFLYKKRLPARPALNPTSPRSYKFAIPNTTHQTHPATVDLRTAEVFDRL